MTFKIWDALSGGSTLWTETQTITVSDGLFSASLGGTTALITFDSTSGYWVEVTVGATAYAPRQRITPAAMALNVSDDTISTAKLKTDAVTSAKVLDNTLTASDLLVNVVSSVESVTNDGGNIDLVPGTGLTITGNDAADTISFGLSLGSIDHNSLQNLTTGDPHTQYFNLSQSETVSGIPAFNGGTSGTSAPFSVDSNYVVSSLNSDLLDGYHSSQTGNFGNAQPHSTFTDCNTNPTYWGWNYVQGNTNCPNTTSAQWYRGNFSLGSEYPMRGAGAYSMELAIPRYSIGSAGVWVRTVENGTIGSWNRIDGSDTNAGSWTLSGTNLYPDSTSYNVGIGMTNPSNKLHVTGSIGATDWVGAGCEGACESSGGYSLLYANGTSVQTSSNRADGGYIVDGNQVIDADGGWHRSYGATGWQNSTYGGGFNMEDTTWVRVYGTKHLYNSQGIRGDAWLRTAHLQDINGTEAITMNDSWLRINEGKTFTSGTWFGGMAWSSPYLAIGSNGGTTNSDVYIVGNYDGTNDIAIDGDSGNIYLNDNGQGIYFAGSTMGADATRIYTSGDRLVVRAEDTDNVAQFANYGIYLPRDIGTAVYAGGDIQVGYANSGDDDSIYMDDGTQYLRWDNANDRFVFSNDVVLSSGEIVAPAIRTPLAGYSSGAPLDVGDVAVDYPGNSGWAGTWNSNILVSGLDSSSISFHDSMDSVATLRYRDNNFYIGESVGWGTSNLNVSGTTVMNAGGYVQTYRSDIWSGWNVALEFPNTSHAALYYPTSGLLFGLHSNGNFYWGNTSGGYYPMTLTNTGDLTVRSNIYITDGNTRITEGSGNAVRVQTDSGYVDIGPQNTGWAHYVTDRAAHYFNAKVTVNGNAEPYTDAATDLGSTSNRWRNQYVSGAVVRSCPSGWVERGGNLCMENADYSGYSYSGCANFCRTRGHNGAHMCTSIDMRQAMMYSTTIGSGYISDYMGDQYGDDAGLYVNSGTDANNCDGADANINDTDRYCRCCMRFE